MKHIVITNYSDPVCVWCWGTEPIFRAMETHYPNRFSIRYVMGGMVRDLSDFDDEENGIGGGDADTINAQLREHLAESTAVHHMPVAVDKYHLFSERFNSSFPQNIAYKAAQIAAPDMADSFLRRIREATLT
ncbi:MAG: DsbA family protein, partial [Megasphaera sp.]|nr:DsbA family protein [Megasphaera sp.]